MKVVIVDYEAGNLYSVARAVESQGVRPLITSTRRYMDEADALIVPGVGAAEDTMRNLRKHKLVEPIKEYIDSGRPFLGVCMGQQALFDYSEENGRQECLGVLPGRITLLPDDLKVPHMGWNRVRIARPHPIFDGIEDNSYFYFVHSYYVQPESPEIVLATTDYGIDFPAIVHWRNIWATQFHPEKSQHVGEQLLQNFARL